MYEQKDNELLAAAADVRKRAHAPYSGYGVGVAVLDENGNIYTGCNVENASYPEGICAEANAIGTMVSSGGTRILTIAVVGGRQTAAGSSAESGLSGAGACTPCGGCRQRIREFANAQTRILMQDADGKPQCCGIDDLLPNSFLLDPPA